MSGSGRSGKHGKGGGGMPAFDLIALGSGKSGTSGSTSGAASGQKRDAAGQSSSSSASKKAKTGPAVGRSTDSLFPGRVGASEWEGQSSCLQDRRNFCANLFMVDVRCSPFHKLTSTNATRRHEYS